MFASWFMARRRSSAPGVVGAVWPFLVDLVALAGLAYLIMAYVVYSSYTNDPKADWVFVVIFPVGVLIFAVCLALAIVTTTRALFAR